MATLVPRLGVVALESKSGSMKKMIRKVKRRRKRNPRRLMEREKEERIRNVLALPTKDWNRMRFVLNCTSYLQFNCTLFV